MLPAAEICERARLARDPRFDGRFFVAVVTTGIYCRPICPARTPARDNVRYYGTAAAAQDAGYRPCLRCRPERAILAPEWSLGSATVIRGLRLINHGYLHTRRVSELASELGISPRHLGRLFAAELGTSPKSIARAQRMQLAKRLLDDTQLKVSEVALAAGYGSLRRFNDEIRRLFGRTPRELRRLSQGSKQAIESTPTSTSETSDTLTLLLPVRQPYDHRWVFSFLALRAIEPLEQVEGTVWTRRLGQKGDDCIRVSWASEAASGVVPAPALRVELPRTRVQDIANLLSRVRSVFDLDADSSVIDGVLSEDALLGERIQRRGGIRVPGAWDGFELGVRAILGQQVSVARATRLAVMLIEAYGCDDLFPEAEHLADSNPSRIGMPRKRGAAIQHLARGITEGSLRLEPGMDLARMRAELVAIPGIGPWTAEYIAMRAGRDPDAFPEQDWVVLKRLATTPAQARRRAEPWRPWRSYALMYLWSLAQPVQQSQSDQENSHV